jgi:hypothetical protein
MRFSSGVTLSNKSSDLLDVNNNVSNTNGSKIASDGGHGDEKNSLLRQRKKIVVVGLGMVALSFMCVVLSQSICSTVRGVEHNKPIPLELKLM